MLLGATIALAHNTTGDIVAGSIIALLGAGIFFGKNSNSISR